MKSLSSVQPKADQTVEDMQPLRRHKASSVVFSTTTSPNLQVVSAIDIVATHAVMLAPLCSPRDLAALTNTERQARFALSADVVCQQVLGEHFHRPLAYLVEHLSEPEMEESDVSAVRRIKSVQDLSSQLPTGAAKELYAKLHSASLMDIPFLSPKAKLILEVHELQEWTQLRRQCALINQAAAVAEVIGWKGIATSVRNPLSLNQVRLLSLHALAGGRGTVVTMRSRSLDEPDVPADRELQRYTRQRINRRREERRRQIEYLQQDLLGPLEWQ